MRPHQEITHRIAFVGNYLPRRCGIATFTTDLCESVALQFPDAKCIAIAMNDQPEGYEYPARVRLEIPQEDRKAYESAADFLNLHNIDMVCLQHEFGIFGGEAGSHILTFLRGLHMPVVTTLHTVLTDPNNEQRSVMDELVRLSDRLVVMSQRGKEYLENIYGVPSNKIDLIPHGIPDVPFVDTNFFKDKFDVEGKKVLLTFGLLSPNKGIEYVLKALPSILDKHPNLVYMVLGATHPHVKKQSGESYRQSLMDMTHELGIEKHVLFYDQFVSLEELMEFIGATDIYITPYLNPSQIVSGALAYTIGAGKAVISTPYWYAEELLAEKRGMIVPFRDSQAIVDNVLNLLGNDAECHAMRKRAYVFGRHMIWSKVAQDYMNSFWKARVRRIQNPQPSIEIQSNNKSAPSLWTDNLPSLDLSHLLRMTDYTGILQHAVFSLPNYSEGYTTDDNARALVLALLLDKLQDDSYVDANALASRYLSFIWYAFNHEKGRFRNFLSFSGTWLEDIGSDDSHGRALWGLGSVLRHSSHANHNSLNGVAARLFGDALPAMLEIKSPRAWAFTLLGVAKYLHRFPGDRTVLQIGQTLANNLMSLYNGTRGHGWYWFEDKVTYNNATLPQALLLSSRWMERKDMAHVALESLHWLLDQQTSSDGYFIPIGNRGFFPRGGKKARFDQQPIEASATVSACLDAYRITGDQYWHQRARNVFEWFTGRNDLGLPVYDAHTGGCHDGLHPDRLNQNQGAESTLAYLLAWTEMKLIQPKSPLKKITEHRYSLVLDKKSSPD